LRKAGIDILSGPLYTVFGNPVARILDQARIVGNMEQTVSMLSEATKLDYKTVQTALGRLSELGLARKSRKIGNAQAYRFNVENELHSLLDWAVQFQHGKRRKH